MSSGNTASLVGVSVDDKLIHQVCSINVHIENQLEN